LPSYEETEVAVKSRPNDRAQQCNLKFLWASSFGLIVVDGLIIEYIVADQLGREMNPSDNA
jgi:hypothetical protein